MLQYCLCFILWFFGLEVHGVLAPGPGIQPARPALKGQALIIGPAQKSLGTVYFDRYWQVALQKALPSDFPIKNTQQSPFPFTLAHLGYFQTSILIFVWLEIILSICIPLLRSDVKPIFPWSDCFNFFSCGLRTLLQGARPMHAGSTAQVDVPEETVHSLHRELQTEPGRERVPITGLPAFLGLRLREQRPPPPLSLKHLSSWVQSSRRSSSEGTTLYP